MRTMQNRLKQAGISLLEVLLSLAIISIILVMAMQYFSSASNNQKMNMVRTLVGANMSAVQSYALNNPGFGATLTIQTLINGGYLSKDPKNIVCDGTTCSQQTPWAQDVTIVSDTDSVVTMTIPLPEAALCQNLVDSYGAKTVSCDDKSAVFTLNTAA